MAGICAVTLIALSSQAQAGHKPLLVGMSIIDHLYCLMFLAVTMAGDHVNMPAVLTIIDDY